MFPLWDGHAADTSGVFLGSLGKVFVTPKSSGRCSNAGLRTECWSLEWGEQVGSAGTGKGEEVNVPSFNGQELNQPGAPV